MLSDQTVYVGDFIFLIILCVLEISLSLDNGIVMSSVLIRAEKVKRKKLLFIGVVSAFILRFFMLFFLAHILTYGWIKVVGGAYLIYLGYSVFRKKNSYKQHSKPLSSLKAVIMIEAVDLIFALDSIIAAIGLVSFFYSPDEMFHKMWIIYFGGLVGMIAVRFLTLHLTELLEKYVWLKKVVHIFIFLIGLKLIVDGLL